MRTYKESLKMFKYNFPSVILFEITFRLLSAAVLLPLIYTVFNLAVELAGINYLTKDTLKLFLKEPSTYGFAFLILLMMSAYVLINISGLIYAMEASHREDKITSVEILFKGLGNALRVMNPRNFGVMVYVLFILPFTYSILISGSLVTSSVPEFIINFITQNKIIIAIAIVVYLLVCIFSMSRIFSLNYYTLYSVNYKEAVRLSKKTIKSSFVKVFFGILVANLLFNIILFMFSGGLATGLAGILEKIIPIKAFRFVLEFSIQIIFMIFYFLFSLVSTPMLYAFICRCFYEIEGDAGYEEFIEVKEKRSRRRRRRSEEEQKRRDKISVRIVLVIAVILNVLYIYLAINDRVNISVLYSTRASVTAHRGDSGSAPENTMAAISLAHENQADIIEIDVRQTSDGEFVLFHDESLYRITGIKKDVGEVDYQYISSLDVGSHFSAQYKGETVPTLEEALIYGAENNIFYNIELKTSETDKDYVEGIMELLYEYDYVKDCVVSSGDYEALKKIKIMDEEVETIYILSYVIGDVEGMEYVDGFSIRYNFVTAQLVENIHKEGQKVYAWTANTEDKIKNLLLMDVDSIITDNPYKTKEIIYNANSNIITDWIQWLINEY